MTIERQVHLLNFSRKVALCSLTFLLPVQLLSIGFDGWKIGAVSGLLAFAPLLCAFPTGWINDRFSIQSVIRTALLAMGLVIFLMGRTHTFGLMALLFLLLGIANNILDVSTNSLYYKSRGDMNPNRKFGLLYFWLALGTAAGPFLGGVISQLAGLRTLFIVFAALHIVLAAVIPRLEKAAFELVSIRDYVRGLFRRKTLHFSAMIFVIGLHWGVEGTVYSPFLMAHFGLNKFQTSLYISLPLFVLAAASLFFSRLHHDSRLNKRLFLTALFLSGAGLILMVNPNVYVSFFFRVIHETGDGFLGALVVLFISRLFETRSIGGSSAALFAVMTFGQMSGALIFAPLGFQVGLQYPFLAAGALLVLDAGYGWRVFRREHY